MSITKIFKESLTVAKGNPLIFVPMLAATVLSAILGLILLGSAIPMLQGMSAENFASNPEEALATLGAASGGMFLFSVINSIIWLLTHGMTVGMADLAYQGKNATLQDGLTRIVSRIVPVIIASICMGIIIVIGLMLLVLPGLILAFFLMFTLIAVIVSDLGAFQAIGKSFSTVGKNFGATFITFLIIIGLAIIMMLLNIILGLIPILGIFLTMIIGAIYAGFVTLFLVRVYREMTLKDSTPSEVKV